MAYSREVIFYMKTNKNTRGLTLIEVLVVIAIITILAALLFPVFSQVKEQARLTQCISNISQVGKAGHLYLGDNDDLCPASPTASLINGRISRAELYRLSWVGGLLPYTKSNEIFQCPIAIRSEGSEMVPRDMTDGFASYGINVFLLGQPGQTIVATANPFPPDGVLIPTPINSSQVEYSSSTTFFAEIRQIMFSVLGFGGTETVLYHTSLPNGCLVEHRILDTSYFNTGFWANAEFARRHFENPSRLTNPSQDSSKGTIVFFDGSTKAVKRIDKTKASYLGSCSSGDPDLNGLGRTYWWPTEAL